MPMTALDPKQDLRKLSDEDLRGLLTTLSYDCRRDRKLGNGLRRMRWINFLRRNQAQLPQQLPAERKLPKNYYFDNDKVEVLLQRYKLTACTDIILRDQIMEHASELIRQIIRAHGLHNIYPGREDSSFGDLFQTAWAQIESVLYKYEKGKAKVFNMWSQVARTVMLAHIKKEGRDRKNSPSYRDSVVRRATYHTVQFDRFLEEAKQICQYNEDYLVILTALDHLYHHDPKLYEGLIGKLVEVSGRSKQQVVEFFDVIRMRSHEFTDAPINDKPVGHFYQGTHEEED